MTARLSPSLTSESAASGRSTHSKPARPLPTALAAFVGIEGILLAITLIVGAGTAFNLLVWLLFTVLWVAFAAGAIYSPETLDGLWFRTRRRRVITQLVLWVLFLPIMVGLWIWSQPWPWPFRLILSFALGFGNILLFLPRSL